MWWSRCAQKPMLEPQPTFWDTLLLAHSLVPLLDPAGSVRPRPVLMLMLMPSSLEDSPLLTTLQPLQATLVEPLAPLLQLLPLLAQMPLAMLVLDVVRSRRRPNWHFQGPAYAGPCSEGDQEEA